MDPRADMTSIDGCPPKAPWDRLHPHGMLQKLSSSKPTPRAIHLGHTCLSNPQLQVQKPRFCVAQRANPELAVASLQLMCPQTRQLSPSSDTFRGGVHKPTRASSTMKR